MKYSNYIRLRTYWDEEEENIYYARPLSEKLGPKEEARKSKDKKFSRENALFNLNFVLDCILRWHL